MAGRLADGWNGWGLGPDQFRSKAKLLEEEAARAGRRGEATWAGIVLVGEDERDAAALLEARHRKRANDSLAEYQRMNRWVVWPEEDFPRTSTQKPLRSVIQQGVQSQLAQKPTGASSSLNIVIGPE